MSYVGGPFKNDLFVSYSHGDVENTGESKLKQWSQAFAKELESELKMFPGLGRDISIFLDQHHRPQQGLDPMDPLTDQLREEIKHSAILSVLMSPHYLLSKWCREEREWWHEGQTALGLPPEGRIAVVQIWPTEEEWPAALCDRRGEPLIGFTFFDRTRAQLRPQPYEWPAPGPQSKGVFRDELLDLVGRVRLSLDELKERIEEQRRQAEEAARLSADAGQVVYLHGRANQAEVWEKANTELTDLGFVVFPTEPDPVEQGPIGLKALRQRRVETISGCDGLLLLGTEDSRATDADMVVVGRQDRQSARAVSNRLLPCALLNKVGQANPRRRVTARSLRVDWIDATTDTWPSDVQRWLGEAGVQLQRARR